MSARAVIVGWSHLPFGKLPEPDTEALMRRVARAALEHAELEPAQVDALYVGVMNSGFSKQGFQAALVGADDDAFRHTPATRVENACATGSAALYAALDFIGAGRGKIALVIGAEKMTSRSTAEVGAALGGAAYQREEAGHTFPQIFAQYAAAYFEAFGDHSGDLAQIAAKNHRNGVNNPLAHMRKDVGFDFCNTVSDKNPIVADPLRVTDCSLISDGAAAVILVADDVAADFEQAVTFRSMAHVQDILPMSQRNLLAFEGPARAFATAFSAAGITVKDLDFAEVHDCFTIAELLCYEAMGLAETGRGSDVIAAGTVFPDGELPINLSGGLKAKGHPVGATGVSMHVMSAMQLTGTAGDLQKEGAELGCVFNMGGSGVANYCSVLERRN